MKKIIINGGKKLKGQVDITGAKNATLPLMVASILTDEDLTLKNVPHVSDIASMANLLSHLGVHITIDGTHQDQGNIGKVMTFNAKKLTNFTAPYELVSKMRASIVALGPILTKHKNAIISLPGGCAIGTRPIDLHLDALKKMGAKIKLEEGYVKASILHRLKGAIIDLPIASVGATENILMAATLASGQTIINNAAREPEIIDLAQCLIKMGAKIKGAGTKKITIDGVKKLHGTTHGIIPDRIEAGTYAIAAAITGGKITLNNINLKLFEGFLKPLEKSGVTLKEVNENQIEVQANDKNIIPNNIKTNPYPKFPTDMQAQFMSLMTIAKGESKITENIFENRFMHVLELVRMGASIKINNNTATINGIKKLSGAKVMATDLRASVSLVLAGLAAKGKTTIDRLYHLERGYERLAEKLINCGADIEIIY